ncbi:unnamed protein product [Cochlearia groenlandica]
MRGERVYLNKKKKEKGFEDICQKISGINGRLKFVEAYVDFCRRDFRFDDIIPDVQFGVTEVEEVEKEQHEDVHEEVGNASKEVDNEKEIENEKEFQNEKEFEKEKEIEIEKKT